MFLSSFLIYIEITKTFSAKFFQENKGRLQKKSL